MKKILIVAIIGVALFQFKSNFFSFSDEGAFDSKGNPAVWVFTFDGCGNACDSAIKTLEKRGIEYIEFDSMSDKGREQLKKIGATQSLFPLIVSGNKHLVASREMNIVSFLAETLGDDVLYPAERNVMVGHFYDDNTPAVIMYGASWCGYCKKMREYFSENDIEYTELDAEGEAQSAFMILKGNGFPLVYIGYRRIDGANIKLFEESYREL